MSVRCAAIAALAAVLGGCVAPQPPAPPSSASTVAAAQNLAPPASDWVQTCEDWDEWEKRALPFRVHGDTYHVGTCGISALLVAGADGHVLLDTGTRNGSIVTLENIRLLGFRPENLEVLLTSHEHFDHVGGAWWVMQNSGARLMTSPVAARVIETGIADPSDPQFGMHPPMRTVGGDLITAVVPGQPIELFGTLFTPIATPGHTPGALTWQWESCEGESCRTIVYADSLSPVSGDDYRFSDHPEYVQAYRDGIAALAALDCDILLTPHPSASRMRDKLLAGDLTSGMDCAAYAADRLQALETRLSREAQDFAEGTAQ